MKEKFEIYIGGYPGPSRTIEKDGDFLVYNYSYYSGDKPEQEIIQPTQQQYDNFFSFLKTLNKWKSRYENLDIYDGTQWSVKIVTDDLKLVSEGDNSYPKKFEQFLNEVQILIGGREFG